MFIDSIVKNGKTAYCMVLPQNAGECLNYAAKELQFLVEESTGVLLPIVSETEVNYTKESRIISLGLTAALKAYNHGMDFSSLNGDGFYIMTFDKSLFICGAIDRGTLYGVYDFAEKVMGVRFFAADCTKIPKTEEIKLYGMNVKEVPDFMSRAALQRSIFRKDADKVYYARCRSSHDFIKVEEKYGGQVRWFSDIKEVQHSSLFFVPVEKYYSTPEQKEANKDMYVFFEDSEEPYEVCLTNGLTADGKIDRKKPVSSIKAAVETLKGFVLQDPDAEFYMFGQMDYKTHCECAECSALTEKYGFSGVLIRFVNALINEVQSWADSMPQLNGKQIKVVTFAYLYGEAPPAKLNEETGRYEPIDETVRLNKNLYIRFAPFRQDRYYSMDDPLQYTDRYVKYLAGWKDICGRLMVWDYGCDFCEYYVFYPVIHRIESDIKRFKDAGVFYYMIQLCTTEFSEFQTDILGYVVNKYLWNTSLDLYKLRAEFIEGYYGPAAENVSRAVIAMEELYAANQKKLNGRFYFGSLTDPEHNPLGFWEDILRLVNDGIEKTRGNNEYGRRLDTVKLVPLYMMLVNRETYFADDPQRFNGVTKEFFDICDRLNVVEYGEALKIEKLREKFPLKA